MPPLNKKHEHLSQIRVLAYGRPKTKKSWWAYRAAEAGFNVHVFDYDNGGQIAQLIDPAYHDRINIIDVTDRSDVAVGALFTTYALRGKPFLFDETLREIRFANPKPSSGHYKIDLNKAQPNDIFVFDTWTSLTFSVRLQAAIENNVDLSDAKKTEWDFYRYEGDYCNWVLDQMRSFRCQWIVVAHLTTYEKYKNKTEGGKKVRELIEEREIIKSTSNPHALTVPGHFTDVLKFFKDKAGNFRISTKPAGDSDAGSRHLKPDIYKWEDAQFSAIAKIVGVDPGSYGKSEAVQYYGPGEEIPGFGGAGSLKPASLLAKPAISDKENTQASGKPSVLKIEGAKRNPFSSMLKPKI